MNSPILLLIFNRPHETNEIFRAIRKAKPPRLYIAADGPREKFEGEAQLVVKTRKIATNVDWPCQIKTLFQEKNIGNKKALSNGINWFFENEEEGIILEDDCLPNQNFFQFSDTLLSYYRNDERVSMITGNNYQAGRKRGEGSYYFSRYGLTWGWASWRRAWRYYDINLNFWPTWKLSADWNKKFPDFFERKYWERIFNWYFLGKIEAWDYPWIACLWRYGGLTIVPNINLVSNIGFGPNATNHKSQNHPLAKLPTGELREIIHPKIIIQDQVADRFLFNKVFLGRFRKFPLNLLVITYRLIKKLFNRDTLQ